MPEIKKRKEFLVLLLLFLLILFLPNTVLARAGGGGGGRGGGILSLILLPFFIIYSAILTYYVGKKSREANALIEKIAKYDKFWDMDTMKRRIETAYFKVQEAWMERDQNIAKDYMSDALYAKHKLQTDMMIAKHEKNILERINLLEARIVGVADFKDDTRDQIWVYIKGSMIDYIVDDRSTVVKSGDNKNSHAFAELWKFIRVPQDWALDEIDQTVSIDELKHFTSFSEEAGGGSA